jgi:hypothetical protein
MDTETLIKLDKVIDKINRMSEAATQRTYWRTMKSAPKDGTDILGTKDGIMATVRWMVTEKYWTLCVPGTFILYHDWDPQMWMPLPPGPEKEEGSK